MTPLDHLPERFKCPLQRSKGQATPPQAVLPAAPGLEELQAPDEIAQDSERVTWWKGSIVPALLHGLLEGCYMEQPVRKISEHSSKQEHK